jgi:hypothetical protein
LAELLFVIISVTYIEVRRFALLTFDFPAKNVEKNFRHRQKPTGERLFATLPLSIFVASTRDNQPGPTAIPA